MKTTTQTFWPAQACTPSPEPDSSLAFYERAIVEAGFVPDRRYVGRFRGRLRPPSLVNRPNPWQAVKHKHILIIDDDPFFRSLLQLLLTQTGLPIASALEAEDSQSALALCAESEIDLIFCDLNLTRTLSTNGIEIVREVRKMRPGLPVYMVTADNDVEVVQAVRSAGATGHILKPLNLRVLKRVLAATFVPSQSYWRCSV